MLYVQLVLANLECPQHLEMLIQLAPQAWLVPLDDDAGGFLPASVARAGP